jgi:hypothetical protein
MATHSAAGEPLAAIDHLADVEAVAKQIRKRADPAFGAYGYADFLRHEKATQLPRNWSALYQQHPAPETGDYFKAEWLRPMRLPMPRSASCSP